MKVLVVGAGAVGGYFGGRLAEAGGDVTFLVRARRGAEMAAGGLRVRSRFGDIKIDAPQTVTAGTMAETFDLILLACKAYDLEDAMESVAPAVGTDTAILPLLNGMRHLDLLAGRFGRVRVLGGTCFIAATLNDKREIVHLGDMHGLTFGELDQPSSKRVEAIAALMGRAKFEGRPSAEIRLDMWKKWVFLATLAGGTCLMRASVGDIVAAPGGREFMTGLLGECRAIAEVQGFRLDDGYFERTRDTLIAAGSPLTASMLRDIQSGARIEAEQIIGDLLQRAGESAPVLLRVVYTQLKAYEAGRAKS